MVKTEAFPTIRMKIDRLLKITNEYQFNDLVKAVYCINLCINNRSVLESCLALNACLIEYEEKGSKRIGTYDEFKGFFGKIYDIIHFLRREMLDFTAFPVFFVSNLLLVQRKKYYFNRATVSRNCSIVL